ncbi:MAG: response regulator [Nitrospirota bacterium]
MTGKDKPEILIVEDSPTQAEGLKYTIERGGYSVRLARNGREALEAMEHRKPTIVITDIMMPEMDGLQLCRKIKEDERFREIPVILLTALSDPEDILRGLECGADNFITKPYDEKYLLTRIHHILINDELRKESKMKMGVEIIFKGQKYFINSERQQILDLLISAYETAVMKNRELKTVQEELESLNESLEKKVEERTAALVAESEERKRAEERALQMQKLESLRVLAGGIAHDLNNLMVAVMGNAGLALHALPNGSPAREYVADIEKATDKVTNFSKQILSFTSKAPAKREPVQINDVVSDTAHFLLASITKSAELEFRLSEDLPAIMADPQSMQQIVMNLIINASDAIGDRKGSIRVSTGKMYADRKYLDSLYKHGISEGEYVYVEVADTGCGMSPETRKRIFEPFFTTKFTGRGIGLSAVFGIVCAHGGTIALESEEGCGATFRILLPVPAKAVEVAAAKPISKDIWSGKGTILLADDEKDSLLMAKKVLEGAGYSVLTAVDGTEAIKIFGKNSDTISAVILDLIMPHVRGDEAAKEIRRIRGDVNILLLSGYHEIDLMEINNGPGKTAILEKPYKITKLLGAVHEMLKA